jgi:hypothetical protein
MKQGNERQNRVEVIIGALDDAEDRELAEEASLDERRAKRLRTALSGTAESTPDPME